MSAVVADTHAVIWFLRNAKQLSDNAATAMDGAIQSNQPIYIASISLVEMVYLTERDRIPAAAFEKLMATLDKPISTFEVVPLDLTITLELASIDRAIVPEMPDRIIAATAQSLGLPLVTRDRSIQNLSTLKTIW
ncbi:PIN domain-containing protein [Leptolyngbya sp. BC1307]|uniref:type II toxin-antitoxin system VapC family toxin n=1 Tax=Leptolyngbya sp. BC1307 TaxID=2029589 RepID=UPI000EFC1A25|nr:PIN domain-containing protein [Leptolyngbya sp. BC1307]